MERRLSPLLLALVLALGAYLRLADLGGPSLWLDEILHAEVTQSLADEPWYRHLAGVREIKGGTENGALYYRLQIWGRKLAPGETGVRLLPAVVGILTLPLMAATGRLLGGRLVALAATFLLAVSPLHVYFSREGRPYALLMAMALLLLYALLLEGTRAGVRIAWAGGLLTAYVGIHAVPVLLSFAVLSAVALWRNPEGEPALRRSPHLPYAAASLVALGLAYGLYMTRSDANAPVLEKPEKQLVLERSPRFQAPLSEKSLATFLASLTTSGHPSVPLVGRSWALLALASIGLAAALAGRRGKSLATAGMFLLPAALSFAALAAVGRSYTTRYTSTALPAFLLLAALGIRAVAELAAAAAGRRAARPTAVTWAAAGVVLLALVAPNLAAARADPYRKLDWRGVARFFDAVALADEPVLVPNAWPRICLDFYLRELGREVEFVDLWESAAIGESVVASRPRGWLLTAGFRRSNEARAWMHRFVPVLKKREEEMDLFFFPDFETLLETRYAAGKSAVFERRFAALGERFDFAGGEMLLQGRGWSYPEVSGDGTSFQWALGDRAQLGLPVGRPRDAGLRLRASPFAYPGAPPQRLEMWLGDARLATLDLPEGWSEHLVEIPTAAWSPGANLLTLRFARTARPADVVPGSGDRRRLSAAFDYLEVVSSAVPPAARDPAAAGGSGR